METNKNNYQKRKVDIVVLSDIHLGTVGCHARELNNYLSSINPKKLILNGDIIDMWQFRKSYFPKSHIRVLQQIMQFVNDGSEVIYITGNHDETLRKFAGIHLNNFSIVNKLLLNEDGKSMWIFHGDVFDITMQHSKWLTRLGATGYDLLILLNRFANFIAEKTGREKASLSKTIKNSVKSAVKYINNFEQTCADIAIGNQYDYVVCGHIHQPEIREIKKENGAVTYLNSGDWIENLTALEYNNKSWSIYKYDATEFENNSKPEEILSNKILFHYLVKEFDLLKTA